MKSNDNILRLENVGKFFGQNFEVIKEFNLNVKDGELVCFIGPSGCGKTVLLYTIAGFLPISSGKLLMEDQTINSINTDRLMIFQDNMLLPWKTVLGNVLFGLSNSDLSEVKKISSAEHYLKMVNLLDFKDWPVHKLSGGMKQRVSFARALVSDPKILLMDEPFSSLDSITRKRLRNNLLDIWNKTKKTILFVTHNIDEAICLADTIHVLGSRPTNIKKTYSISLPRPRNMSDPNVIELIKSLEKDLENDFDDKNQNYQNLNINNYAINS